MVDGSNGGEYIQAIAADLRTSQTARQQDVKARGLAVQAVDAAHTAAQTHAILRAAAGCTAQQMVSEYRALRCPVASDNFEMRQRVDHSRPAPEEAVTEPAIGDTRSLVISIDDEGPVPESSGRPTHLEPKVSFVHAPALAG